jgi:hypothetical protein
MRRSRERRKNESKHDGGKLEQEFLRHKLELEEYHDDNYDLELELEGTYSDDYSYRFDGSTDRTSSLVVNGFTIHVDRDHRGRFRGHQSMSKTYRGWHYHVDHDAMSQNQIFELLEKELIKLGAKRIEPPRLAVGYVEESPTCVDVWKLGDRQTVLWISKVTGTLHIEANKTEDFAKSILTKPVLKGILQENAGNLPDGEGRQKTMKDS